MILTSFFFFFQAEDGIRDIGVTGVQTCALPICWRACEMALAEGGRWDMDESGRQHWVPGEAVWSHPQVPYLQFIEIWIQLVDGRVWSMLSRIDDGSGFHGLYLVTPEASESDPGVPASIGYRDRLLAELPLGLVRIKDMRRDADG